MNGPLRPAKLRRRRHGELVATLAKELAASCVDTHRLMKNASRPILTAAVLAVPAAAQQVSGTLDPLVVTASRAVERVSETAYTTSVIGAGVFESLKARTVPEALGLVPGVLVQKTAHGHGSPYIRGFTGRQNLYLIDGIRLNNSSWRGGPVQYANTLDPHAIDRLEVVKGQGSVLYGSDAIGGTVNALSKSSGFRDVANGQAFFHGASFHRFDTNSESHVGRLETRFGQGGLYGVTLGISAKNHGDIRDSAVGLMRHTGYSEQGIDFKLEYAVAGDVTLTLAHQYLNQDDIWRWHSTIHNPGWTHDGHVAAPGTYLSRVYDQERSLTYARIEGATQGGAIDRWSATLSWQQQDDSEYQLRTSTDERFQWVDVDTYGLGMQLESDLGPGTLIYGADYYRDEVDSYGERNGAVRRDFRPVADDSRYENLGAFAQYRWRLAEPFTLTAGARYTHAKARLGKFWDPNAGPAGADRSATRDWDQLVSSLRGIWKIDNCWSLYGGVSQGFRAPNLDDLSGNLTSRSGQTALGNVDVDPEEFTSFELGVRRENETFSLGAAVFYTDIDDVITSVPVAAGSNTTVTTNGQDGYIYGIEAEARWRFAPQWTLTGFGSWQDGQTETAAFFGGPVGEEPVSRLMPLTGSLALRWTRPDERLWIEGRVTAAAEADRLSSGDKRDTQRIPTGGTPGYVVASLYGGWQATENALFTLGFENVTDEDYRIHGSGQNEPGFNAIAGLRLEW